MNNKEIIKRYAGMENIIEIGEEITRDLDSVSSVLRESVESIDNFYEDNFYRCDTINKSMLDYISRRLDISKKNINKFEEELETYSNYDSSEEILSIKSDIFEKLDYSQDMNMFLRIEFEDYLIKIESVKGIVEDIILNLNKQRTDPFVMTKSMM